MPLMLITAPVGEPITLAEAKLQVQQFSAVDDGLLSAIMIPAARDRCEDATQRALLTQTYDLYLDGFPSGSSIVLPKPPLRSVTSVQYYDTGGTLQTLTLSTDYLVQAPAGARCQRGRIALPQSGTWPATISQIGAVIIRFVCGYGAAVDVPPALKAAMLLDIGRLYANREDVITGTIMASLPDGVHATYWRYRSHPTQRRAA